MDQSVDHEIDNHIRQGFLPLFDMVQTLNINTYRILNLIHLSKNIDEDISSRIDDAEAASRKYLSYMEDVGRAAVVFLHATLETAIREVIRQTLLNMDADEFIESKTLLKPSEIKFSLADILNFQKENIDIAQVINLLVIEKRESIDEFVDRNPLGNTNKITRDLASLNYDISSLNPYLGKIKALIDRRHEIAHAVDIYEGSPKSFDYTEFIDWFNATHDFCVELLSLLKNKIFIPKVVRELRENGFSDFDEAKVQEAVSITVNTSFQSRSES